MANSFTVAEVEHILSGIGASGLRHKSNSLRCRCPLHSGDNYLSFSTYQDDHGFWRSSCFSHGCATASLLEWVVAKARQCSISNAVAWIGALLSREDLVLPTNQTPSVLPEPIHKDVEVADDSMVQRLQKLYPYHAYWKKRGFTPEIVAEYGLTYRSLDNRAVIPFYDLQDHLVGVMTRALDPKCEVKYLWESPNSAKGEFLFGMLQALRRPYKLEGRRIVFLVEGTLDVVKASSLGYPIVATNTNRVSGSQALDLLAEWDTVILIPDNDEPGQQLVTAAKKHVAPFVDLAVAPLTTAKDLDSLSVEEVGAFLSNTLSKWSKVCHARNRKSFRLLT